MRDRMERLVLFPFAVGCMSESSIGIASQHPRRSSSSRFPQSPPPSIITKRTEGHEESEEEDQTLSGDQCSKTSWPLPKPNLSVGMNRLFKGFKNFSHLFVYKEDQDEEEGEEMEIEIGVPTDVKHVTHIGWDGFVGATNNYPNNIKGGGCSKYWRPDDSSTADFLISDHQKLKLLAAKFNDHDHYHHHQLDQVPFSSTTTADPAPIPGDLHDQDCEEIASALRSRSIIDHH